LFFLPAPAVAAPPGFVPGQILIKPRSNVSEAEVESTLRRHSVTQHHFFQRLNIRAVRLPEANAAGVLEALKHDPAIEFAERDYLAEAAWIPNDPFVLNGTEWHLDKIQAPLAWTVTTGNSNVVIAVLDSGINANHPDLAGNIIPGYDFVSNDTDTTDDFGHGTAVSGVIAAAGNNGIGVAGVAFGATILPVKVMDAAGFAAYSTIAQGIHYAVDNGARVINISIAGAAPSSTLQDAVNYAWSNNVVVVAAAGNNGNDTPQYPAACEHAVAVSATSADDSLALFSSFGQHIALAAPGVNIFTTSRDLANPYGSWSGTSLASPMVAAAAALAAAANPALDNFQIITLLEQTTDDLGPTGFDNSFGFGRLNVARAVAVATGVSLETPAPPPAAPPPVINLSISLTNHQVALGANVAININAAAGSTNNFLASVGLFLNGAPFSFFSAPPFTLNWKPLIAGNFSLTAVAMDDAGLCATSSVVPLSVYSNIVNGWLVAPLSLAVSGLGALKPNLNGSQLVVGRTYAVTATPGPGQIFAGWEGIPLTNPRNARLVFQMQPGLSLVAKFVANPFLPIQGNYAGLALDPAGVTPESSGSFTLTVTTLGVFSGRLSLGGTAYALRGALDLNGDAVATITRTANTPLTLLLHLDLLNGTDEVSGCLVDGAWKAAISGDRNVFSAARPAVQAGKRAFILQTPDAGTNSAAKGLGTISMLGRTTISGALKDGRKFNLASTIGKTGDFPFYLPLSKTEAAIGWLSFPQAAAPLTVGTVFWVKSGTNAFSATLQAASIP
jgi:thermitase